MRKKKTVAGNKLLITQQEMVLIKNSNAAKNTDIYGNLYDCLEQYKSLSKKELEQNIVFDDKARIVLLNIENKKALLDAILKEWYSFKEFDISEKKLNCQLCGRPNKYIFYIHNKITDVDLHIGSDCVTKFPDITGIQQEKRRLSQVQKENKRRQRKIEFEILEGDDLEFLERAEKQFSDFKIMLPYRIHCEMKDTLYQLNLAKTSYIKSGGDLEDIFKKYILLKNRFIELFKEAETYYDQFKEALLICDKDTADWLYNNKQSLWEKVAKNGGLFDSYTLKNVYYNKFVERMLPQFKKHLNDKDIQLLKTNGNNLVFSIQNARYMSPISFLVPMKKFMETVGCYCLTDAGYSYDKSHLEEITIENTRRNFESLYNSNANILKQFGYDFIVEEKTAQAYWVKGETHETRNRWSSRSHIVTATYKKSDISLFLKTLSPYLLKEERVLEKEFGVVRRKMECGKTWMTQKEKNLSEQIAKEARGMQRQREFVPY